MLCVQPCCQGPAGRTWRISAGHVLLDRAATAGLEPWHLCWRDDVFRVTDDLRVTHLRPLLPPAILLEDLPLTEVAAETVATAREHAEAIIAGQDDRLLAVVGPCSIHDPSSALEYGARLKAEAERFSDDIVVIMRVYFEKPRTTIGWKGLINDPDLDGSFKINHGLRVARQLLLDLAESGLSAGHEFLDTVTPQYIADVIAWGAIGARTAESQIHRQLASGLSMPVGFKNGTRGSVRLAVDGVRAAASPHHFMGVTKQGISAIVATTGNPSCHVILRGGDDGPNYGEEQIFAATDILEKAELGPRVMVDCSHGNSNKDYKRQPVVAAEIARQIAGGSTGVMGVMIESNLASGNQPFEKGKQLQKGLSVTDACIGWDDTVPVLEGLAKAVRRRRRGAI